MFDEGLKTSLWIASEIRRCDIAFLPMTILHKGDEDRGLVLIKQYISGRGCFLYTQKRDLNNKMSWHRPLGEEPVPEYEADQYIARQRNYDDDLWVVEVDDPKGQYIVPL